MLLTKVQDLCEASQPGSCNQPLSSTARFYAISLDLINFLKPPEHTNTKFKLPFPLNIRQTVLFRMDRMKNGDIFEGETNYVGLEVGPTSKAREKRPGDEVGYYNGMFL